MKLVVYGGTWRRLGPWAATIADGTIEVTTSGLDANLSGIEIWRQGTASTTVPTATPTNIPVPPTPTSMPVGATATPAPTQTSSTRTIAYSYDGLQRLTGADASVGADYTYTYDLAGNRTDGGRTYNAANQITNAGYSYAAAGNLTGDDMTSYAYDALSRVKNYTAGGQDRHAPTATTPTARWLPRCLVALLRATPKIWPRHSVKH